MRVLVFGDSITQGYWDVEGGWVERLRRYYDEIQLQDLRGRDEPTIFNLGVSADTSEDILQRIKQETIARTRHGNLPAVVVQIGVNDSLIRGGTRSVPIDSYKANLETIIASMSPLSSKLMFVGLSSCDESQTLPVSWGDYCYDNTSIKSYENAMQSVANALNIPFIPVFDEFMQAATKDGSLLPDGLHPSNQGHEVLYQIIKPKFDTIIRS